MAKRTKLRRLSTDPQMFSSLDTQVIYCGDNLEKLKGLPAAFVDLVYIDPPFNSNRDYEVFWPEDGQIRHFEDRHGSNAAYINFMRPRCAALRRVLKPTGSFFYHCDWHASHWVRMMLDEIMGEQNFRSEIIWKRSTGKGLASKGYGNNHDTIFYYTGGPEFSWNRPFDPYDMENLDEKTKKKYSYLDPDGRRYTLGDLNNPNPDRPNLTYDFLGHRKVWRWTRERMQEAYENGMVVQPSPGAVPRLKRYLDEREGRPIDDVWVDIPPVNSQADERIGYPTQKPIALLDRIIQASSNPDDVVLDAFCGCGTALVAAQSLGRRWIGIDISPTACNVMQDRLEKECLITAGKDFTVRDERKDESFLRRIPHFEFENWAVLALGGIPNVTKVNDWGIDGRIYPATVMPRLGGKDPDKFHFMDHWYPVQVKQKDKAGRQDIDGFVAAMIRAGRSKGYFVSFDFTSDAKAEIRAVKDRSGQKIVPITVREILEKEDELFMKLP